MANDPIKLVDVGALDRFKTDIENEIPDSVQYSTMPTASADLVGKIVQYTGEDAPGLGYDLINGHWYKCESWGTGYIWTDLYTDNISNSSKPVISSAVSSALQAKQNIIQVAEMPTASSARVGDILQYIGTTTVSYTNGYFYKCVPGSTSGTYQWTPVSVQSGSPISSTSTTSPITDSADGYVQGLTIKGRSHKSKNLFDITSYPLTESAWIYAETGNAVENDAGTACTLDYIPCSLYVGQTLTLNKRPAGSNPGIAFYNASKIFISGIKNSGGAEGTPWTFTVPTGAMFMRFTTVPNNQQIQLELGSTATAYESYGIHSVGDDGLTVTTANSDNTVTTSADFTTALPLRGVSDTVRDTLTCTAESKQVETVCCEVDLGTLSWIYYTDTHFFVSNDLISLISHTPNNTPANIVTNASYDVVSRNNLSDKKMCINSLGYIVVMDSDYTDAATFKSAVSGVKLVYELAEPVTTPLTDAEISAFRGLKTYDNTTNITITDEPEFEIVNLKNTENGQAVADIQMDLQEQIDDLAAGSSVQYSTMPTATVDLAGKIVQYTGPTTASYTNGYFYKCVNNSGTYSWQAINVQAGGGDVSSKADKVSNATIGNFAGLDTTGNLTDSGKKASDFATSAQGGKADTAVQTIQIGGTAQTKTNGVVNLPAYPTTLPASDTTSSYSASGTAPVNGTAVAAALGTLDVSSVGGSGKYIRSISETDGKISATAADMPTSLPASDVHDWAKASSKPSYTASEVGAIATTAKGAANGVAELDSAGKVPSSQLPSFVDDVLEYTAKANFPTTGEAGKIYVDKTTNLTWRWSGTTYVEISPSLALGETSSTAYRGDRGKTAYTHATDSNRLTTAKSEGLYKIATTAEGHVKSVTAVAKSDITGLGIPAQDTTYSAATQSAAGLMSAADKTKLDGIATGAQVNAVTSVAGKTGAVTLNSSDVGLGNVGNFKAVSTVASQGLSSTEQANARANIGAGTSNFNGAYSSLSGRPTLGTAAAKNVASSGNASTTQVVMGNDTRLSDARTPKSHSHDAATTSNAGFMSASDKTKLNGLANIKSVGSGLDLNGSTGELTATGGGGESDIQVFKSTDFPRVVSGNQTFPVVSFEGHAGGKILAIVPLNKTYRHNGTGTPARYIGSMPSAPYHYGNNMFAPIYIMSQTSNGVTVTNLGDGGFKITGTATGDTSFNLGPVFSRFNEDDNHRPTVKCFGVSGSCGSLKVGNTTEGNQYKYDVNGGSGVINFYYYSRNLYLYCTSGETYNCIFYPQITDAYLGTQDHYEKPFSIEKLNNSMLDYQITTAVVANPFRGVLSESTAKTFDSTSGNYTKINGIVNYPIVHCGINHIVGASTTNYDSTQNDLFDFAVYYADNYQKNEEEIINDSTLACMLNRGARPKISGSTYFGGGSGYAWTITFGNSSYYPTQNSFIMPDGVEFKYSGDSSLSYKIGTMYYYDDMLNYSPSSTLYYYTSDEFKWSDDSYKNLTLDLPSSVSKSYYVIYQLFFDYDGFDDTPSFQTI